MLEKYDKECCLMPRGGGRVCSPRAWVISGNLRLETKSRENILSPSLSPSSPYVVSRDLSVLSIEQMIAASYKPSFL